MDEIREINKLPLTFKYVEYFKKKTFKGFNSKSTYYMKCEKYQTDFYVREKPVKNHTRLI